MSEKKRCTEETCILYTPKNHLLKICQIIQKEYNSGYHWVLFSKKENKIKHQ